MTSTTKAEHLALITEKLALIERTVKAGAERSRLDAGLDGRWDDGGASTRETNLKYFLDGVKFADTGETKLYKHILEKEDPKYKEYLELKARFEKIS